ncbi:MAG: hypothetical protein K940chlam9_00699 [Chlamydiae bacterium]|nr:hypothetical protein [Chlamydiota bacterium]
MEDHQEEEQPPKEPKEKNKYLDFLWTYRIELFSGILVLIGLILSYFYVHIGGALLGLGFGACFFEEIYNYFSELRDLITENGIFKTLILVATILFFLIAIPSFIMAVAVGFVAIYIIKKFL